MCSDIHSCGVVRGNKIVAHDVNLASITATATTNIVCLNIPLNKLFLVVVFSQ
eukprot:Gb_04938 [translate_table: standard]